MFEMGIKMELPIRPIKRIGNHVVGRLGQISITCHRIFHGWANHSGEPISSIPTQVSRHESMSYPMKYTESEFHYFAACGRH